MKYFLVWVLGYVLGSHLCVEGNSVGCVLGALMLIVLCFKILRFLKNVIRFLHKLCSNATDTEEDSQSLGLRPHYNSTLPSNASFLANDLLKFEIGSKVPEGLSYYIASSKEDQAKWYRELLKAWKEATPPPKTADEAARLVIQTLNANVQQADVERLLAFYALPVPHTLNQLSADTPTSLPKGVQFEQRTGKTFFNVLDIRVVDHQNEEILARQDHIRLRYRAPELLMPYGNEAKEELVKLVQGKCLRVLVYDEDIYGRTVADVYCDGIFVQEVLLKRGCAWHYKFHDQRLELARWQKEAQRNRVGLWAFPNPEEPWEWRRRKRQGRNQVSL
ncbi:hypothetical protein SLEP1_g5964 [Rubroshorea leprosula]|uniref:TNase-like domain-containing protein n=1 Tax=Rubroshorea leprosula TaxID=152421 RepID=A0AAV5I3A5_9ROSI|nr:hypothetical protein SLEP1_g5964 [Rubroshorea leprosula]